MNFKKYIFIFSILLFSNFYKAQNTVHPTVFAGYEYQNQSFGELGARFIFLKNDDALYRISGSALLGSVNGKFAALPKIQADVLLNFEKGADIQHSYYFLVGAETTTKFFAPKAGFSLFGIVDVTGGYAFNYGNQFINEKELKGFNFNFTVNIPLVVLE
ncbi:hypothetical protein [Cloacibacterium sp.]|uniref:hypothetical protein n=1 Tax=Cloacibacterium sp. TaxID=1913682 RepID=UPI0039E4B13A